MAVGKIDAQRRRYFERRHFERARELEHDFRASLLRVLGFDEGEHGAFGRAAHFLGEPDAGMIEHRVHDAPALSEPKFQRLVNGWKLLHEQALHLSAVASAAALRLEIFRGRLAGPIFGPKLRELSFRGDKRGLPLNTPLMVSTRPRCALVVMGRVAK